MTWTVFITHYLRSAWLERIARWLGSLVCAVFFFAPAQAQPVAHAEQLKVEQAEEAVLLTTQLQFELPLAVEGALQKGIPLFFVAQADVVLRRWYWMDKTVARAERYFRVAYQPLTRRWRLTISSAANKTGSLGLVLNQYFESLGQALAAVKKISHWQIADVAELGTDTQYTVEFRFKLDLTQLPLPLQIGTLGHSDWDVSLMHSTPFALESAK